ncbi:MAG: class I SAM-dependent methyltransferase [Candidatus Pacebacteria bacterium]|nr:class I SAM-dependent methyltransferase [Candidatus Paceibacterota bacterium]
MDFLNPDEVLNQINLRSDMTAADFGSSSGGFTIPLAKRLEDGLVYALDIQEAPLSSLKGLLFFKRIKNVRIIRCDLEKPHGSTLPDSSLDLVLISNVLFQSDNKNAILKEAERVLRQKGELVVIDWLKKVSQGPNKGRVSSEEVKKLSEKLNFKLKKEFQPGKYHFGLIFIKK